MPNVYAQKMIDMMNRTGQPMTTTTTGKSTGTTTVKQPNEGLDLSSIMLMLMMNSMFKDKKPVTTPPVVSATNFSSPVNMNPAGIPESYMAPEAGYGEEKARGLEWLINLVASLGKKQ